MHTPRIDICKIVKEGETNLMVKQLLQIVKDSAPGVVHECPYTVSCYLKKKVLVKKFVNS